MTAMSPNLEDRIRLLIDQAMAAETDGELDAILIELKTAIREHIRYVRAVSIAAGTHSKGAA
jgi:hypothetical protein